MRAELEPEDVVALRLGRLGFNQQGAADMRVWAASARAHAREARRTAR
jgi:hypothetical protein